MRAVFLGTPSAAVPSLAALVDVADVSLVVTRPDRPKGRNRRPAPSAVKLAALDWGFPLAQPVDGAELRDALSSRPFDIGVVVAYGVILDREALAATRVGFVNVHLSLLPRWRGAAPVERAILAGDPVTGVSLMKLDEGLDTGPIISVMETPIAEDETGGSLTSRLSHLGARLLAESLPDYVRGALHPAEQIGTGATYARRLEPSEGLLDPGEAAALLARRVRAFHPRPGTWVGVEGHRLAVTGAAIAEDSPPVGRIVAIGGDPVLGTADGGLTLLTVRPEGRKPQSGRAWMNGRRGEPVDVDA